MERRHITGIDEFGNEITYDIILTFHNDKNSKDYIVYTDNSTDKYGKLKIYSSVYDPHTEKLLGNPETRDEWDQIFNLLDEVFK